MHKRLPPENERRTTHFPHFNSPKIQKKEKEKRERENMRSSSFSSSLLFLVRLLAVVDFLLLLLNSPPFLALQIVLFLFANASPIGTQKPVEMGNVSEEVPDESEREGESRDAGFDARKVSRRDGECPPRAEVREV